MRTASATAVASASVLGRIRRTPHIPETSVNADDEANKGWNLLGTTALRDK